MKRVLLTLLAVIFVSVAAHGAVYIGDKKLESGVTYTKSNCKWIKYGSVLFEDDTYACHLYLNDVDINTVGEYERGIMIDAGVYHNCSIHLKGKNYVYSDLDALVCGANYNEIEDAGGSLELHSSLKAAVLLQDFGGSYICDLRLWDGVTFIAEGKQAVSTKSFYNSVRVSGNCNLWLKSTDNESCAVEGVQYFYLHDSMSFILPENGKYDQNNRYMVDSKGSRYTGEVKAGEFPYIYIGGEPVSSWNWDNIKPECLKSGSISYDKDEHVLTFNNATLEWDEAGSNFNVLIYFVYNSNRPKDFTIRLIGDNYLNLNKTQTAIYPSICTLRIEGDGTLNIHSPDEAYRPMIYITPHYPVTLACKSVKMVSESTNYNNIAFIGAQNSATREDRKLIIDNTRLDITSPQYTFFEVDSIITNGVELIEPEDAYFDYGTKKIMVGDNNVVPHVVFDIANYPVKVKGTQVTWKNKNDVLGDGTVSYNPDKQLLILNNAHITTGKEAIGIHSEQDNFNIYLLGKNTITSEENAIASVSQSDDLDNMGMLTISGPGSLDVRSNAYGIETAFQHLLLADCGNVNVKAPAGITGALSLLTYAFGGTPTKPLECLGIMNSNLTVEADYESSDFEYAAPLIVYGMELDEETVEVVEPKSWKWEFPFIYDTSTGTDVEAKRFVVKSKKLKGDVNLDGAVNISDVVAIINQMAGTATYANADVNSDGGVNISDVVAVINIMAGK